MTFSTQYFSVIRRDPSIVSYWRLNETSGIRAYDWAAKYSLNGIYDGSPTGNLPLINNDQFAGSKLFGSLGQNVEIPDASPLRIIGDIAIEVWIINKFITLPGALMGKMNSAYTFANPFYCMLTVSNKLKFSLGNGINQTTLETSNEVVRSVSTHVVMTCFRKNMFIFINGIEVAMKSLGEQEVKDGGNPVFIGALGNNTNRFTGMMGEVALYNAGFSLKKAKKHYEIGRQILSESSYIKTFDPPVYS